MNKNKELLKKFIIEKVAKETSEQRPYYLVRWSGLFELAKSQGFDLLKIIDELVEENKLRKALIPSKKNKKEKLLALYLPNRIISKKQKQIISEFEEFIKNLK
jgi:hypothetical protein